VKKRSNFVNFILFYHHPRIIAMIFLEPQKARYSYVYMAFRG